MERRRWRWCSCRSSSGWVGNTTAALTYPQHDSQVEKLTPKSRADRYAKIPNHQKHWWKPFWKSYLTAQRWGVAVEILSEDKFYMMIGSQQKWANHMTSFGEKTFSRTKTEKSHDGESTQLQVRTVWKYIERKTKSIQHCADRQTIDLSKNEPISMIWLGEKTLIESPKICDDWCSFPVESCSCGGLSAVRFTLACIYMFWREFRFYYIRRRARKHRKSLRIISDPICSIRENWPIYKKSLPTENQPNGKLDRSLSAIPQKRRKTLIA